MSQFVQFILHHWVLCGLFVVLLIVLLVDEVRGGGTSAGRFGLSVQELVQLINKDTNAAVIDLRAINAYKDGHIINSINIPQDALNENMKKIERYKQQAVVLVCLNAQKSRVAALQLKKQGFEKVYVLKGGISAWTQAGMPVTK